MLWRRNLIDGTFGDKTVLLTTGVIDRPKRAVLLFHGVHSNAAPDPGNKYAGIGLRIARSGNLPILAETSRKIRNRADYQDDPMGWVNDAFAGKTFRDELTDFANALTAVRTLYPALPVTMWGFSLGGLIALLIAGGYTEAPLDRLDSLVICGSGDSVFPENVGMFKLPILSTLTDSMDELHRAAAKLGGLKWLRVFRGTQDSTFPSSACKALYDSAATADKAYYEIEGSDHTFRFLDGKLSHRPLNEVYKLLPQLFNE